MKQFKNILKFELLSYLRNKVFMGATIFLVVAIALVMFFPRFSSLFEKEEEAIPNGDELPVMLVKSESEETSEITQLYFASAFTGYNVKATTESIEKIKEEITNGNAECAFVMNGETTYTYYVDKLTMYDSNTQIANSVLQEVYRVNAMISGGLSPEQAADIMGVTFDGNVENLGADQVENYIYTYIMIIALYTAILLYGQMVASNVASEKSSRAMEVLVTSAKPISMMFGKVIASCVAGIIQLVAVFGSSILFYSVNKEQWADNPIIASIFDMPVNLLVYMLVFFVLGFLIYAFLYGAIGSMASKLEDINTSSFPLTFMFIIAYIVVVVAMSVGNFDSMLMKICSYIPFTAPMAMFTRIAMGAVPTYGIFISMAILVVSAAGIGVLSAKIYRVGVLLYGTPPKFSAILKALKKS